MVVIGSTRELHSELDTVCSAFEALFKLNENRDSCFEAAAVPALRRFRELLDSGDAIVGPDSV